MFFQCHSPQRTVWIQSQTSNRVLGVTAPELVLLLYLLTSPAQGLLVNLAGRGAAEVRWGQKTNGTKLVMNTQHQIAQVK